MNVSSSTSQPSSNSGYRRHWVPPAPKSVRVWAVVGPSREVHELAPPESPPTPRNCLAACPLWALQLTVFLALLIVVAGLIYLSN
jgi:hypothetical protein